MTQTLNPSTFRTATGRWFAKELLELQQVALGQDEDEVGRQASALLSSSSFSSSFEEMASRARDWQADSTRPAEVKELERLAAYADAISAQLSSKS